MRWISKTGLLHQRLHQRHVPMISLPLQRAKDRRWYVPFGRSSVRPSRALGSSYSRVSLDSVTNVCDGPPPHLSCALVPLALGFRHNPHSSPPNPLWIEQRGRRQDTREHGGDRVIKSKNAKKWRAREADIALADPPGKSSQAPSPLRDLLDYKKKRAAAGPTSLPRTFDRIRKSKSF